MLKDDKFEIFSNINIWEKRKDRTIFRSELELEKYQKYFLKKLLLEKKRKHFVIKKHSSGSTSNEIKTFDFPRKLHSSLQNHHMWKIMHFNNIKKGNALKIFQSSKHFPETKNKIVGPFRYPSMGLQNNSWELLYDPSELTETFWEENLQLIIKKIKPNFIYTSPSVFECFYEKINCNFNFPIIFSCEILTDKTRKKAESVFLKSIDKMRDWSTGLGFFECNFGTKHIYDELCLVEQINENSIKSIDFFNYHETDPFKISDDRGVIKKKMCDCGLYGNFFESFEGKFFEHLVSIKEKKYSANYIANLLSSFDFLIPNYQIVQKEQKNIIFKTEVGLNDRQALSLGVFFKKIIADDGQDLNLYNENKIIWESKKSNIYLKIKKEKFKINKNKKISLRTFVS